MTAVFASLREWLRSPHDRPLLLGPSLSEIYSGELSVALRRSADAIVDLQRGLVEAGADLVVAPTAGTTAPALHTTGQAYRAAALTAAAVDLTRDGALAGRRPASVLGEVPALSGSRAKLEARTHVERLVTSAVDGLLVVVSDTGAAHDIIDAASSHRLPTLIEVDHALAPEFALPAASVIIVRGSDPHRIAAALSELHARLPSTPLGARIVAPERDPQLAVAGAWSIFAGLSLAVIGVGGAKALDALAALADLSRAPRESVPGASIPG